MATRFLIHNVLSVLFVQYKELFCHPIPSEENLQMHKMDWFDTLIDSFSLVVGSQTSIDKNWNCFSNSMHFHWLLWGHMTSVDIKGNSALNRQ